MMNKSELEELEKIERLEKRAMLDAKVEKLDRQRESRFEALRAASLIVAGLCVDSRTAIVGSDGKSISAMEKTFLLAKQFTTYLEGDKNG